jgi:serine/threonine protein kinase
LRQCGVSQGTQEFTQIYYENYPYLFEEEIENRVSMDKHFEEEELWYLLYSLVTTARDFSSLERKVGDIRPSNIFINEEGQLKIANLCSWPYEKPNFDKTAFEKQLTYLSPEEMRLVAKGHHQNTTDHLLSESFSIGLTLLEAGLLFKARELYSLELFSFDSQKLGLRLN